MTSGDVDATGRDVGRDQRHHVAALELGESFFTLALAFVAVHRDRFDVLALQSFDEAVGAALGADEDERAPGVLLAELLDQQVELRVLRGDREEVVLDHRLGVLRLGVGVRAGLVGVGGGDAAGGPGEGRREEERLAIVRGQRDDPVDGRAEAHVEHPVGLVEDEDADLAERDEPRAIRSSSRPGVATRMSARPAALIWGPKPTPP